MKRFFAFFMTVVLVVAMSVPAFAALGGFISSPSGVPAPQVSDFKPVTPDCTGKIVVTSWADRHTLDDATRARFEKAYNDIINLNSDANNELLAVMKDFEKSHGLDHKDLAVGSLFDISSYNCTHHEKHEGFIITLKPEVFGNIVGVAHLTANGWEVVEDTMDEANQTITFQVSTLSPFALVYNTNPGGSSSTGDSSNAWIYVSIMVASVVALGAIGYTLKKREN
ncbi:MAG: hypothetical protein J6S71_06115 [Clostridia bacterium]|nr:hypothetical protein [Clostridia bacterium]